MASERVPENSSLKKTEDIKVAVLAGGVGAEREISLQSGKAVSDALKTAGLQVILSDITPANLNILDDESIDVFFPALHGEFGEDGQLQRIMDSKGLVYAGSGWQASELAFDKWKSKSKFENAGIKATPTVIFENGLTPDILKNRLSQSSGKYVVKPARQGSSVGISIVDSPAEAIENARKTEQQFGKTMIETYIKGREITVGIVGEKPLDIVEVKPAGGFYDYHAKYDDEKTGFEFDTIGDKQLERRIKQTAVDCFNLLGCRDFSRVDFILAEDDNFYVLEVNTIPGFTTHSLLPMAAGRAGMKMPDLCRKIVEMALGSKQQGEN